IESARGSAATVRLLPHFDSFLLAHRDRAHLIGRERHPLVSRPQGWVYPTILVDGQIAGTWSQMEASGRLTIRSEAFAPELARRRRELEREAADLARFLGYPSAEVTFGAS